jgi:hypothetical protein
MIPVKLPSPSWANMANKYNTENPRHAVAPTVAKAVYRPPKLGDQRLVDGRLKIYTRRGWITPYDADGEYGGPYEDACDLFANKRYQHDMKDIYGIPFEPSLAEECRDPRHLDFWDHVREVEDRHGFHMPPRPPRDQRSRNMRNSHFSHLEQSRQIRKMTRRKQHSRSVSRNRKATSRSH